MKPYFLRNKIGIILIVIFSVGFLTPREKLENTYYIWNENLPFPSLENMDYPKNSTDVMVHRAGSDKYNFLHDAAIVEHNNKLYAAWYNCPSGEMQDESLIRVRSSEDNGLHWSNVSIIVEDKEMKGIMYVPVSFLSYNDILYAFI